MSAALPKRDRESATCAMLSTASLGDVSADAARQSSRPRHMNWPRRFVRQPAVFLQLLFVNSGDATMDLANAALAPRAPSTRSGRLATAFRYSPTELKSRPSRVRNPHTAVRSRDCSASPKCNTSTADSTLCSWVGAHSSVSCSWALAVHLYTTMCHPYSTAPHAQRCHPLSG